MAESDEEYAADTNEAADDVIILGGGGILDPIKWTFPNSRNCPFTRCSSQRDRNTAIIHFKENHANNATMCVPCNKVLLAKSLKQHQSTKTHLNIAQLANAASNVSIHMSSNTVSIMKQ